MLLDDKKIHIISDCCYLEEVDIDYIIHMI